VGSDQGALRKISLVREVEEIIVTFVELPTKSGCEARGKIRLPVHVRINCVIILDNEADL
jgi:hypothetical protein